MKNCVNMKRACKMYGKISMENVHLNMIFFLYSMLFSLECLYQEKRGKDESLVRCEFIFKSFL